MSSAAPYLIEQTTKFKLDRENDIDFYKLKIDTAGLYFLTVSNISSSISLWIYILDKEGTPILPRLPTSNDGSTISVGKLLDAGDYYVKLNAGNYEYSNQEMSFTVMRDLVDTFEVNNTINTAYSITQSKCYRASIYPENDLDYFTFTADSNQVMRFQLDSVSSRITMRFILLDNEGMELKTITGVSSSQSMDIGYALKKGTYYVKLYAGMYESSQTPYRFLIRKDTTDKNEWNDNCCFCIFCHEIKNQVLLLLGSLNCSAGVTVLGIANNLTRLLCMFFGKIQYPAGNRIPNFTPLYFHV
jgi:hypothetical protein